VNAGATIYPGILFLYKKRTLYLLTAPQVIWPGIMPQSVGCITIQGFRNHECHSEPFLGGKTCDFMAQMGRTRTGCFSGAHYEALW